MTPVISHRFYGTKNDFKYYVCPICKIPTLMKAGYHRCIHDVPYHMVYTSKKQRKATDASRSPV